MTEDQEFTTAVGACRDAYLKDAARWTEISGWIQFTTLPELIELASAFVAEPIEPEQLPLRFESGPSETEP